MLTFLVYAILIVIQLPFILLGGPLAWVNILSVGFILGLGLGELIHRRD